MPPPRPNQVWTVDFKGWFRTADGGRQDPLTGRDLFSRYGLCLRLLPNQGGRPVRRAMRRLFGQRGLPDAIRVDNGSPFGGNGALGLSRLSVWWLRLGIRVEFTRRARPGDNAGYEQFHGCYQREVVAAGAVHRAAMQQRSTRWLAHYNEQRPHEARGPKTPAQVYRKSRRAYLAALAPLKYPPSLGGAAGTQPRAYQMARPAALCRPGLCRAIGRIEGGGSASVGGVSGTTTHRPFARARCGWPAPRTLAASQSAPHVTHVLSPSCHPRPVPVPDARAGSVRKFLQIEVGHGSHWGV